MVTVAKVTGSAVAGIAFSVAETFAMLPALIVTGAVQRSYPSALISRV